MNKVIIVLLCIFLFATAGTNAAKNELNIELSAGGFNESNIFHSYADSLETSSMLNILSFDISKKIIQSKKWRHKFSTFADFDLYPSYSERNKNSYGVAYEPDYQYNKKGKLSGDFSFSRRNKDLIDDSGQLLSRTLKKNDLVAGLTNQYKFNKLTTEQFFEFADYNYDETYDTAGVKATSYDYKSKNVGGSFKYEFSDKVTAKFKVQSEKTVYAERNTYAVSIGVKAGGRLGVREFRENSYDFGIEYNFDKNNSISLDSDFRRRSENYENFYGYDQWQHRVELKLGLIEHNTTKISFRTKAKDYENYHTANTGAISPLERVSVDYADFQIKNEYEFSQSLSFLLFVRNFDKTSNDQTFEYKDFTIGTGFTWSY